MKALLVLILALPLFVHAQPYEPHVIWDRSGETDSSAYGYKILPLGDQNDDGFADWAVKAQGNGGGWHGSQLPYLEFFHGAISLPQEPSFTYQPDTVVYAPGFAVDVAGDINGDGSADWLVSLWERTLPANYTIQIFLGGPSADYLPDIVLHPVVGSTFFPIGDFNGDGFDDLYWKDNSQVGIMYFGGSPMDTVPDWGLSQPPPGQNQTRPYAIGDFNGDGASDFLCFNPNNWNAVVFLGGAQPDTVPDFLWTLSDRVPIDGVKSLNEDNADELVMVSFNGIDVSFGRQELSPTPDYILDFSCEGGPHTAVSAGDFNWDGYRDMITYVPSCTNNMFGSLTLHLGSPWLNAEPTFIIDGNSPPFDLIGIFTAAGLGDVNGDSVDDIAIGAWDDFAQAGWQGRCVVLSGDDSLEVSANDGRPEIPTELYVSVYPNPFNSSTVIEYELPRDADVRLRVYDVLGREVAELVNAHLSTGRHRVTWEARDLTSGVYLVVLDGPDFRIVRKAMMLH